MDELGVDVAVIMGQQSGATWGIVDNADIAELSDRYPGRFVGFAGVDARTTRTASLEERRTAARTP